MTSRGGLVTVLCTGSAGSDASLNLYSLKMSRVLNTHPNATSTTLLNILHHNLSPQVIYPIEGSSSTGSVTQNFLTLRMTQARCHDAGVYICEAAYLNNDIVTHTADDSLSVTVNPGQLTVTPEPDFEHWAVNNTVTLTCTGPLGTVQSDSQRRCYEKQ
ncbi:uncharacterized protein [Littorina saxatilis]|uniref:uncharacterized protein n=1 Tax=Littorina saxatilis TaxID=31220 RepID=UPI0038B45D14